VEETGKDIRRALESVKEIASSIIILESTTKYGDPDAGKDVPALTEIAKEYNAAYYCQDFKDDRSQSRNVAIRNAEGDFILFLDPDEEVNAEDKEKVSKLITAKHYDVFYTKIVNYDVNGDIVSFYYRPRIFRKSAGFHYSGEFIPKLIHNKKEKYTGIIFKHYGYALSKEQLSLKISHDLTFFKKQIEREPDNPYCYFHAAEDSELICDFEKAKEYLEEAVKIIDESQKEAAELKALLVECYFALSRIALCLKEMDAALENAKKGYEIANNSININFILGEIYFTLEDYEAAYKHYKSYLEFREMYEQVEVKGALMVFDGAYYMNFMTGKTLMLIGRLDEAFSYFEKALEEKPDYASAINELGCLYQLKEDMEKAGEYFKKAYELEPDLAEAVCNHGVVTLLKEPEKGLELIKKALDMEPDNERIKNIYQDYSANKDKILEKRRVSVCISAYDYSKIKDTAKNALDIADEFIIPTEKDEPLKEEDVDGKKVINIKTGGETGIAAGKNLLVNSSKLDWVLFLNEGEYLDKDDLNELIDLTREKDVDLFYLSVKLSDSDQEDTSGTARFEPRLFRRNNDALFDNIIFDNIKHAGENEFTDISIYKDSFYNKTTSMFQQNARVFSDELASMPKNYYAHFMLGKLLYSAKNWEQAEAELELARECENAAIDDKIGFPYENMYLLGCVYMNLKKTDAAKEIFKAIVEKDKDFFDAYFQLGRISCSDNEDPKQGIEYISNYFKILDSFNKASKRVLISYYTVKLRYKAHYYLGMLYQKSKEFEKAGDSFNNAIKAKPDFISPYIKMADILTEKNDLKEAKGFLEKAIALDDKNFKIHYQLAAIHLKEEDYDSAKDELEKCIGINSDNIEALSLLGDTYESSKNFDKAEHYYRAVIDKQPQDKDTMQKLGDVLLKKEDDAGALEVFRSLQAMDPSFMPANISVGSVLMKINDFKEAETHFADLMKKYPTVPEYVLHASKAAMMKKNFGDALDYFEQLLKIDPESKDYVDEQKKTLKEKGII
jgi:tetratricopeptide (TPR) repeat protein